TTELQNPDRQGWCKNLAPSLTVGLLSVTIADPHPPLRSGFCLSRSEISLTLFVTAITVEFNCIAGAFTRRAAILRAGFRLACARWVFAFFYVRHDASLVLFNQILK